MSDRHLNSGRTPRRLLPGALIAAWALPALSADAQDELRALKAAAQDLQARIAQLEAELAQREGGKADDAPASSGRFSLDGDFRYRNETIDRQYASRRNRDRLRLRAGIAAGVNDTVRAAFALATSEGNDPRSSNVTLGNSSSRKDILLDLAYVEWQAAPSLKFTAGKMKYPWERAGDSVLFDGDVNPEGLAVAFERGALFGSAFHHVLAERSGGGESRLTGTQLGWKPGVGAGRATLAVAWFDFHGVRGRDPFHDGDPYGNTTITIGCRGGAVRCLAQDFNLVQVMGAYELAVARRPLALFVDYLTNEAADNGLDAAWSTGLSWGRAAAPRSWELGYAWQVIEKDALFGQFIDSDVGGGNTDHRSHVFRAGYAIAPNWTAHLTYMLGRTGVDVAEDVPGVGAVRDRDYQRLQLDLNFRF